MTETATQTVVNLEIPLQPELVMEDYARDLVNFLDQHGVNYSGFPGREITTQADDGTTHRIAMGVTEPYPDRSPRFGAIMSTRLTRAEHLVVSDAITKRSNNDELIGYAVTNVRNDEPSKLMVSHRPRHPESWVDVDETDASYGQHLALFASLTGQVVNGLVPQLEAELATNATKQQKVEQQIEDQSFEVRHAPAKAAREVGKKAKALDIDPEEIDELHADQTRLINLIDTLDRKRDITGQKRPRSERPSRREHRQAADQAARTLETSYGIQVKHRKVGHQVVQRVLADELALTDAKATRDSTQAEVGEGRESLARNKAHRERLASLAADKTAELGTVRKLTENPKQ